MPDNKNRIEKIRRSWAFLERVSLHTGLGELEPDMRKIYEDVGEERLGEEQRTLHNLSANPEVHTFASQMKNENKEEIDPEYEKAMKREELLEKLIGLDAGHVAIELATNIADIHARLSLFAAIVCIHAERNELDRARELTPILFAGQRVHAANCWTVIYRHSKRPADLTQARTTATPTRQTVPMLMRAIADFMEIWRTSEDPADLKIATDYATHIGSRLQQAQAWHSIARVTKTPSHFLLAFEPLVGLTGVQEMLVVRDIIKSIAGGLAAYRFKKSTQLSDEACGEIIRGLQGLNAAWAQELQRHLATLSVPPADF